MSLGDGAGMTRSRLPRVIVLGGTGFVGRHVCSAFALLGFDVVSVSRRPAALACRARTVTMDLGQAAPAALAAFLDEVRPQVVVNAAGAVWEVDEAQMIAGNTVLVRRLVEALQLTRNPTRLVQIGSVNEYSPQPVGRALDELTPTAPVTTYGRTKLHGSEAVLAAAREGSIDAVVLRMANLAGPGSPPASLLGNVARRLRGAAGGPVPTILRLAPLRARRDFVDALDAALAIRAAALTDVRDQVVNVGSGTAVETRHLVDLLISISEVPARVVEEASAGTGAQRGPEWLRVDIRAARELLGWSPARRPEDSIRDLWAEVCGDDGGVRPPARIGESS